MEKKSRLTYAVLIVMTSTLLSRLVGFVREMLLPNMLTVGVETDAYNNAFVLPDLMYSLLLGGAVSAALIPVLSGHIETDNEKEGWNAVSIFINTVFIIMFLLCIAGMVFSKELMGVLISGEGKDTTRELAANISRVLFPAIAFLMLSGILNGVLNSYKKFAAAALGPIIYNIGSVLSVYFLSPYGVEKIAYGILASSCIYFLTVLFFTFKKLRYYRPVISYRNENTRKLFKLAIPSFFSASVIQLNIMISMKFVNFFEEGKVTAFKMADRTWQMPYGIIAVSMGIALLPTLSGAFAKKDIKRFTELLTKTLKYISTLIFPCAIAFFVLNERIVSTLFKFSSKLTEGDVVVISKALLIFSIALMTQSMVAILNRAFYSIKNSKIPLYTGVSTIILNVSLSYIFYKFTNMDINGIALAYSLSSVLNLILLSTIFKSKVSQMSFSNIIIYIFRIIPALAGMGATIYFMDLLLPVTQHSVTFISKIKEIGLIGSIGLLGTTVYFALIIIFKVPEGIELYNRACKKLKLKRLVINVNK